MNEAGRSVRLTIPARHEYITLGRLALTALAGVRPVSDEVLYDLKLALTEACTNSVRHAYENGRMGNVEIVYELSPDRLAIEVGDEGADFEPIENSDQGDDHVKGGLRFMIYIALDAEVETVRRSRLDTTITLVLFLTCHYTS